MINCGSFSSTCWRKTPIGVALATILSSQRTRLSAFYRSAIFIPTILSFVIVGFACKLILSPIWGIASRMLIYVALLSSPDDTPEVAQADSITVCPSFWKIKLPLILPSIGFITSLMFVANFNAFDLI